MANVTVLLEWGYQCSSNSSSGLYLTWVKHLIVYNTDELAALNLKIAAITNMIYNKIELHYITVSKTVKLYMAIC